MAELRSPSAPRVAFVCGSFRPERDGVADYVGRLAVSLREVGVRPTLIACSDSGLGGVLPLGSEWGLRGTAAAARMLDQLRPDLVHVQFAPASYRFSRSVGLLPLLRRDDAPLVTTLHEYGRRAWPGWVPDGAWRALERHGMWDRETLTLLPSSAAVLVTNDIHARAVAGRHGAEPAYVPIGSNVLDAGADPACARREVRLRLGIPGDATLLLFFGFVHPVKGVRHLIEALAELRVTRPDTYLVVVGGFTSLARPADAAERYRTGLEEVARAAGVREAVTFTGHLPAEEVSEVLHAADIAVLPSTRGVTTRSGALLAAFEHRLPVVATRPDQEDHELVDGHNVVLVDARRDHHALAAAVRRVLDDAELRERVAAGGAAVADSRSWKRIAEAHARLYERVLSG